MQCPRRTPLAARMRPYDTTSAEESDAAKRGQVTRDLDSGKIWSRGRRRAEALVRGGAPWTKPGWIATAWRSRVATIVWQNSFPYSTVCCFCRRTCAAAPSNIRAYRGGVSGRDRDGASLVCPPDLPLQYVRFAARHLWSRRGRSQRANTSEDQDRRIDRRAPTDEKAGANGRRDGRAGGKCLRPTRNRFRGSRLGGSGGRAHHDRRNHRQHDGCDRALDA